MNKNNETKRLNEKIRYWKNIAESTQKALDLELKAKANAKAQLAELESERTLLERDYKDVTACLDKHIREKSEAEKNKANAVFLKAKLKDKTIESGIEFSLTGINNNEALFICQTGVYHFQGRINKF
jgi:hypothetical protein